MDEEFGREELQNICSRATNNVGIVKNQLWKDAYRDLANAADRLDAMMARTQDDSS